MSTPNDTTPCLGCGVQKPSTRKYCTRACFCRSQAKPEKKKEFVCKGCGKIFVTWAYRPQLFCSRLCSNKWSARQPKPSQRRPENFLTLICLICGKEYAVHKTQTINGKVSRTCSNACRYIRSSQTMRGANHPNFKGYPKYNRGSSWSTQRKQALQRDGNKCQICGRKKKLGEKRVVAVHHIIPYRLFNGNHLEANKLSNLITLCRRCHTQVEDYGLPCPKPLL